MSALTLSQDGGGRRHFVDGRPVHCGTGLQWSPDYGKTWIAVRYEVSGDFDPVLYLPDGGRMVPGVDAKFRWPSGSGCHSMTRSQRPIKIKVLPDDVLKKLEARRGHYSDFVSVFHVVDFDEDSFYGVAGDGDNGSYEWFIYSAQDGLETSDCGYGGADVALSEVRSLLLARQEDDLPG